MIVPATHELPVQTPNTFARRLTLLGRPGPYRSSLTTSGVVDDRDGHMLAMISPEILGAPARREAAEIAALALNRLCGFPAVEDRLDPAHLAAAQAESARFAEQAGGLAEAGE
ncbi:hypothetical protein [Methylobacterium brachiatum]|uniref:hypothetical protein n=1 Tax=Methylobacterium brachiatum TaxID=269660 RepID=UPI000EFB49C9|nr:hypothetical protein [Methylobacterium brachiatum]AYO81603.1 hypothetical protein EBB05_04490 [Methylobacterium brachiatum]